MCQCAFNNFICFRWKNMFFGRWFLRRIAGQVSHHVWGVHEHRPGTGITSQRIDSKRFCFDAKTYLKVLLFWLRSYLLAVGLQFCGSSSGFGFSGCQPIARSQRTSTCPWEGNNNRWPSWWLLKPSYPASCHSFQNISMWYQHLVKFSIQTTWWFFWSQAFTIFGVFLLIGLPSGSLT